MSQATAIPQSSASAWLLPLIGLASGAAHAAAWHYIPLLVVSTAITMGAVGVLWATAANTGGSKGFAIIMALLGGVCALASSWAVWLVIIFGIDGLREMMAFGGVGEVMANVGFYLELFEVSVSRRGQTMPVGGDELRVFWMILAGIWIVAPLVGAVFRRT